MLTIFGLFAFAAIGAGEMLGMYDAVWWWDDMLHGLSGIVMALAGLIVFHIFHPAAVRSGLVALFCFTTSVAAAAMWEIFEFSVDFFFHTAMQQWDMPPQAIVMGATHQGMGLRDTMSDIILATIGAAITTVFIARIYRSHPVLVRRIMSRILPWQGIHS